MAWIKNFLKRVETIGKVEKTSLASVLSLWSFLFIILITLAVFLSDLFGHPISQITSSFLSTTTTAAFVPSVLYIFGGAWGYCTEVKHRHVEREQRNQNEEGE